MEDHEGEIVSVNLPLLDKDAADKLVDSGKIVFSLLNYLALNPHICTEIYPNQEKFGEIAEREGISIPEVRQEFVRNHRAALIAIAYVGKVIVNQVSEHFDIGHEFDLTPDNMLMDQFTKDYGKGDAFDIEAALAEVSRIMKDKGMN